MNDYLNQEFNLNDENFVSSLDELSFWSAPFGIKLLEAIPLKDVLNVLDIGCGTGFPLLEIAMRLGQKSHITGIDPWKAGLTRIRDRISHYEITNISLIEGVAENMPVPSEHFDLLVSNNGINNVQNLEHAFKECSRVAKKGAKFLWTMNTDGSFKTFYDSFKALVIEKNLESVSRKIDEHIYLKRRPIEEMKLRLAAAGFEIVNMEESSFSYRFSSASAMFRHTFIRLAFLDSWKKLVQADKLQEIFTELEKRLNGISQSHGELQMDIPFVLFSCVKI
jgi:arsenite methyltransferase